MKEKTPGIVISQKQISASIFDLVVKTSLYKDAHAGCFVGIYTSDKSKLLPRPISICEVDKEHEALRFVYRVTPGDSGTKLISTLLPGDTVMLLGVLGNGFPLESAKGKRTFLIGGGIGVPPILELAKEIGNPNAQIIVGYRNSDTFLYDDFTKYGKVYVATEDGSVGSRGNVMNAIAENNLEADVIMACGPMPMLRAIKKYAEDNNIIAYISLEEHMACGVGACLGCVVKTKELDAHSHVHNARICTDGPVFDAREVEI